MGQKFRGLGPHLAQSPLDWAWGLPPYQVASWCMQLFGHNRNGSKIRAGALPPFLGRVERGLHPTQSRLGWGLAPYQVASWSMQPFGRNRYGPKIGWELCPFGEEELGPHLTQCGQGRGLPARQVLSWSVQPFGHSAQTSQTDRQTGQDRQTTVW